MRGRGVGGRPIKVMLSSDEEGIGSSVFESQLNGAFASALEGQSDLFSAIALVFYHDKKLSSIYDVYKLLGLESFIKLVYLLEGRQLVFPTSEELKNSLILVLCFYYREIDGLTWKEIHDKIPFKFSSVSVASKLKSLNATMYAELKEIVKDLNTKDCGGNE